MYNFGRVFNCPVSGAVAIGGGGDGGVVDVVGAAFLSVKEKRGISQ